MGRKAQPRGPSAQEVTGAEQTTGQAEGLTLPPGSETHVTFISAGNYTEKSSNRKVPCEFEDTGLKRSHSCRKSEVGS